MHLLSVYPLLPSSVCNVICDAGLCHCGAWNPIGTEHLIPVAISCDRFGLPVSQAFDYSSQDPWVVGVKIDAIVSVHFL